MISGMNRKKSSNRIIVRSVAMSSEEWSWVKKRVGELRPMVANRSHYIRQLISLDKNLNILCGNTHRALVKSGPNDTAK